MTFKVIHANSKLLYFLNSNIPASKGTIDPNTPEILFFFLYCKGKFLYGRFNTLTYVQIPKFCIVVEEKKGWKNGNLQKLDDVIDLDKDPKKIGANNCTKTKKVHVEGKMNNNIDQ